MSEAKKKNESYSKISYGKILFKNNGKSNEKTSKNRSQKIKPESIKKKKVKRKKTKSEIKLNKKIVELKKELDEKDNKLNDYIDTLQRLQAEFENYRKRILKEQSKSKTLANMDLIKKLLPILDDLEKAIISKENKDEVKAIIDGIDIIYKEFDQILNKEGVREVYSEGEIFDPRCHHAIMQIESDKHEEGTVLEVLQKGYLLNNTLLRPATVKVSKKTDKS
ncbi:MAG: nucleotide exchange factor GrpE [Actinobacteria bacterium]|nr:nucleotide exchange factor GrpE [Actinomycetota bacterium]